MTWRTFRPCAGPSDISFFSIDAHSTLSERPSGAGPLRPGLNPSIQIRYVRMKRMHFPNVNQNHRVLQHRVNKTRCPAPNDLLKGRKHEIDLEDDYCVSGGAMHV